MMSDTECQITYKEQKACLEIIEKYVEALGYNLEKLAYPISCNLNKQGIGMMSIDFGSLGDADRIYIKFGYFEDNPYKQIIISVIKFQKIRMQYGTLLLSKLVEISEKYNYQIIELQGINEASRAFGEKFGFNRPHIRSNYMQVKVSQLKQHLMA